MGYSLPVFFFPVEKSELPEKLEKWNDVIDLLSELYEDKIKFHMYECVSRNWWHQATLDQICKTLGIRGLEFILSEVVYLDAEELTLAAQALDQAMGQIAHSGLPQGFDDNWADSEIRRDTDAGAFQVAQPSYDISTDKDSGFEATVAFYAFIKSLRQAIDETIAQGKCLLYVMTQA